MVDQPPSVEAQAAKLRSILQSAFTATITIDDRGLIESVNSATERLCSYHAADLNGRNVKVLMPELYEAEHDGYLRNYVNAGVKTIIGIGREVSGWRKDGTIEAIAAHCDVCSARCSSTIRTARSRTSAENLGDVL